MNGVWSFESLPRADSATRRLARHRGSASNRVCHSYSLVKQPGSFPRRTFCARGLLFASRTRNEGWAEHRETYGRSCEAPVGRVRTRQALVRRLASLGVGRSPLGAPQWRFWARGRASLTGLASRSVTASSSHPGPSARRAGSGASRGERLPAGRRGTPLLAPSSRRWL